MPDRGLIWRGLRLTDSGTTVRRSNPGANLPAWYRCPRLRGEVQAERICLPSSHTLPCKLKLDPKLLVNSLLIIVKNR